MIHYIENKLEENRNDNNGYFCSQIMTRSFVFLHFLHKPILWLLLWRKKMQPFSSLTMTVSGPHVRSGVTCTTTIHSFIHSFPKPFKITLTPDTAKADYSDWLQGWGWSCLSLSSISLCTLLMGELGFWLVTCLVIIQVAGWSPYNSPNWNTLSV